MRITSVTTFVICLFVCASHRAQAVTLFLDSGGLSSGVQEGPITGQNPSILVAPGETTMIHLWALPDADHEKTVVSVGIDVVASGPGAAGVSALDFDFDNPLLSGGQRWSGMLLTGGLNVDGKLVSDQRAVHIPLALASITGGLSSAIAPGDPGYDADSGAIHLGALTLHVDPSTAPGSVEIRLAVSPLLITNVKTTGSAPPEPVYFGYAGATPELADGGGAAAGATSATADATLIIRVFGDSDGDGDVDLVDYNALAGCMNGPNNPPLQPTGCQEPFDFDQDGDVDVADAAAFTRQIP